MTSKPKSARPGVLSLIAAVAGGLAAGAGAAHLLHREGHRIGLDLRLWRPEPEEPAPPSPEDYDAREPGRGRLARRPEHIPLKGWVDILWRTAAGYFGDRVGFIAGGVTFFFILSVFPTLGAFVSLYSLFADPSLAWERLQFLYSFLPPSIAEFLGAQMQRLAEQSRGGTSLALAGALLLSLWAANGGVRTLFYGLNLAYHEVERRSIVRYHLTCMAFTLGGLLAVLLSTALVVGAPVVLGLMGLEHAWAELAPLRWLLLFLGYVLGLAVIYRYGPCRAHARWRWLAPGAVAAALLSLSLSFLFSWFLNNFVRLDSYGPLAAVMGFFLWTWFSTQIVLMGARFNAEIEHQTAMDTTSGAPLPIGERGAVMADNIGARRGSPAALAFTLRHAEALSDRLLRRRRKRRKSR